MAKLGRISKNSEGNYYWERITEDGKTIAQSSEAYRDKDSCKRDLHDLLSKSEDPDIKIIDATGD